MMMDTGGSSGSQSSTLIIRGLALGELSRADVFRILWKEVRVAFVCGVVLGIVNFLRVMVHPGDPLLGLSVSLALLTTVTLAKLAGCMLPLLAKTLKLDPAVMSAPIITTIVDIGALLIFFSCAKLVLGI